MKRPDGIKLTTALMAIALFLHLVAALAGPVPLRLSESHGVSTFIFTVLAAAVVGVAIVIFESFVLWFYWFLLVRSQLGPLDGGCRLLALLCLAAPFLRRPGGFPRTRSDHLLPHGDRNFHHGLSLHAGSTRLVRPSV
jgi:hypothetical protein